MFYRVTEIPYEGSSSQFDYEDLDGAKKHVDIYYRDRVDYGNHCDIVEIEGEKEVRYKSPYKS